MTHQITVLPANRQFTAQPGQTVLDAALAAGIMLPYSCKNGACASCKGKVVEGTIVQGPHQAQSLTPDEAAAGMALFCCARAQSDLVIEARVIAGVDGIVAKKMPCRVAAIERPAADVAIVRLQLPASEKLRYNAGQYLELILKDGVRRSYSMASPPHAEGPVELHIRHLPGGLFTDHVFGAGETELKVREILRMEGPFGSFFLREDSDKPIVLLASGTGFAPVKAIVEHMVFKGITRPVSLYWGGRRPQDLYLDAMARQWAEELPNFRYVPVVSHAQPEDHWTGRTGYVHLAVLDDMADLSGHEVYACGAPAMVASARTDFVHTRGLPEEAFLADAFTSQADLQKPA